MDDFVLSNLHESKNEWCVRLVSVLTPMAIEGIKSIFKEAWNLCVANDETAKYLMTFQNLLCRIPKWNSVIVEEERKRIVERSGCNYLEELITCVHIIQLKVLTCIRVGNKQKKIDINIPKLDTFVHKMYINIARKVYTNVYLFEQSIPPLAMQKNNRELELIVQECILLTVRDSIPTEEIIRAYMEESVEQEEEVIIEQLSEPVLDAGDVSSGIETLPLDETAAAAAEEPAPITVPTISNLSDEPTMTKLTFTDYDKVIDTDNVERVVTAPKTLDRLERISTERALQRKMDEMSYDDDESDAPLERLTLADDNVNLDFSDIEVLDAKTMDDAISLDFEQL